MSAKITDPDEIRALIENARVDAADEFRSIATHDWGLSEDMAEWAWKVAWAHGRTFGTLSFFATCQELDPATALALFQMEYEAELIVELER
jgi:hypothetical protein